MGKQLKEYYDAFVVPMAARYKSTPTPQAAAQYHLMVSVYNRTFVLHEKNRRMQEFIDLVTALQSKGAIKLQGDIKGLKRYYELTKQLKDV